VPIYEYQCDTCGLRFERRQHMNDEPLKDCPECEGHVHRVIQPVGVIFKGSGFYITDSRHKSTLPSSKGAKGHKGEKTEGEKSITKDEGKDPAEGKTLSSAD
jgi:putative FmdB family regulatory protein